MEKHTAQRVDFVHRPDLPSLQYEVITASHLLAPAIVLPEQFYPPLHYANREQGEVALMRAVLADAVSCYQNTRGREAYRNAKEAERWIFTNDRHWPFSFVNICAVLGLDTGYVRLGLLHWKQNPAVHPARKLRRQKVESKNSFFRPRPREGTE